MFTCSICLSLQIAEWLNLNEHDEFMNIYAKVSHQLPYVRFIN